MGSPGQLGAPGEINNPGQDGERLAILAPLLNFASLAIVVDLVILLAILVIQGRSSVILVRFVILGDPDQTSNPDPFWWWLVW